MSKVKSMQILRVDELTARLILSFPGLQRPVKFSFEYSTSLILLLGQTHGFLYCVLNVLVRIAVCTNSNKSFVKCSPLHRILNAAVSWYFEVELLGLIWSKYCVKLIPGKSCDFIRMDAELCCGKRLLLLLGNAESSSLSRGLISATCSW